MTALEARPGVKGLDRGAVSAAIWNDFLYFVDSMSSGAVTRAPNLADADRLAEIALSALSQPERQEAAAPRAYIVHKPDDEIYGRGSDGLQFHPLVQHDLDNGYSQTPLYTHAPQPDRTATLEAEIAELRAALKPFADYAVSDGFGLDHHGNPYPDGDGVGWIYLTNGDFRAAARAINKDHPHE